MSESLLGPGEIISSGLPQLAGVQYIRRAPSRTGEVPAFLQAKSTAFVRRFHESMPEYAPTPLVSLEHSAKRWGVGGIYIKDESQRFGLNAFKALGGSYAIFRAVCEKLGREPERTTYRDILTPEIRTALAGLVFYTATDGNHGKGVAWAAAKLGCRSIVYMPKGSAPARAEAIRAAGALQGSPGLSQAIITELLYDDAVRFAAKEAEEKGGLLVQDTSWEGYEKIPEWIVQGYTTLALEAAEQMEAQGRRPSHVFLQAGVGAMAGGVLGALADRYADALPTFVIAEPDTVACIYASAKAGGSAPHPAIHPGDTIMAGLNCAEPCPLTWPLLRDFPHYYFSCPDYLAAHGMRALARPGQHAGTDATCDSPVISGESGAVTYGLLEHLLQLKEFAALRSTMGLDEKSCILCINTEGDTDPDGYADIVTNNRFPSPFC